MILQALAVRDRAANAFGQPFFSPSVGIATRSFADEVNRADQANQVYKHPEDFDLYHLGNYDDATGAFIISGEPRMVAVGKDLVKEPR